MKMEFIFNKEKLARNNYTEEDCLNEIRKHFKEYTSQTIKEIRPGFFIGTDDDWEAFASTAIFPHYDWFINVIEEWFWYLDEGDGFGEQKGDCLEAFYEVKNKNS